MNNLNQILIEGNLIKNPEMKHTPKGTPVCTFAVASNRYYKQDDGFQQEVSFFDITTWAQLAENCGQQLSKGRGVRVIGQLRQDRWQDTDGKNRSRIYIVADHVIIKPEFKNKEKSEEKKELSQASTF